jgi:hypothetical protein
MHRRKNYRKPVMTKLPASVGITTTGDVGMTGANRGEMTAAILVAVAAAVVQDAVISARSAGRVVAEAIASVVSAAEAAVTGIAIPARANCLSLRKECA